MLVLLKAGHEAALWAPGPEHFYASAMVEALTTAEQTKDPEGCPVDDITPTSLRMISHYGRCQNFRAELGGLVPPCADIMDADVRDVHAFNVIFNENERIRKLEKAAESSA